MKRYTILVGIFLAFFSVSTFSQHCGCQVSKRKRESYNLLLNLSSREQREVEKLHAPFGLPSLTDQSESVLHQDDYIIGYDEDLKVPLWVSYRLTAEDAKDRRARLNCFRSDPRLSETESAICEDYKHSGFDRGHMVPNADMRRSEAAMINTYMFTNMCPQFPRFNQDIWAWLEGFVRDWAEEKGAIYIITGAVFDRDGDGQRDADFEANHTKETTDVAVPTHFYKIILNVHQNGFIEALTVLLPHSEDSPPKEEAVEFLESHIVSIDDIEDVTGINFFEKLEDNKERAVERFLGLGLWPTGS